jgi:hypothetical protein
MSAPSISPTTPTDVDPGDGRPLTSGRVVRDVQPQCPGTGAPAGLPQRARRSLRRFVSPRSQLEIYSMVRFGSNRRLEFVQ